MEFVITEYNLVNIFSFLDKKSLCMYDSALLEKKKRDIFLDCLKKLRYNHYNVCKWTYNKQISNISQYVYYLNIQYLLPDCKNAIVYTKNRQYKHYLEYELNINNNSLENIYIDFCMKNLNIKNILCPNLLELTILNAYVEYIEDMNFLYDILQNCPKIKIIKIVRCEFLFNEQKFENVFKNYSGVNKNLQFSIFNSRSKRRILI